MTDPYTPQVGDRVRLPHWGEGFWLDVKYVDADRLAGYDEVGIWYTRQPDLAWQKVEVPEPLPELWCNVYQYSFGPYGAATPSEHGQSPLMPMIVKVHLIPDGDGYRAEVIRP